MDLLKEGIIDLALDLTKLSDSQKSSNLLFEEIL